MTPEEAAVASADAISGLTSRFMLDMATYQYGGSIGFPGMSFYTGGRGGVLGDVDAEAVTAAFVFFAPHQVQENWDTAGAAMPRRRAAEEFAKCSDTWAEEHIPDDIDVATLATLAEKVASAADASNAPVFAGWRQLTPPESPKAKAAFHMNSLRELRNALHGAAVLAQGIDPRLAVSHRQPYMSALFGWGDPVESSADLAAAWNAAEDQTNAGMAKALSVLTSDELDTFVALANAANAATA